MPRMGLLFSGASRGRRLAGKHTAMMGRGADARVSGRAVYTPGCIGCLPSGCNQLVGQLHAAFVSGAVHALAKQRVGLRPNHDWRLEALVGVAAAGGGEGVRAFYKARQGRAAA